MCGRYTVRSILPVVELFGVPPLPEFPPRFNVAPTQDVPVVRSLRTDGEQVARRMDLLHWGLVPSWADDPSIGNRMINARAETACDKPAFRTAMSRRRCLVPADGFYEWKKLEKGKRPYLFRMKGDRPFAFAGLWETWRRGDVRIDSFTILTTAANDVVAPVHDRMPVIIPPSEFARWLDPSIKSDAITDLLKPYPASEMETIPVTRHVNSPANDDPRCCECDLSEPAE
ncbi:MAG TPA: SOS response-associated peptidase [Tepidisphaeraceae bacterium]|nr:SOS response-associated peptidase [Tepidisphaeraceae bacterium]